MNQSGHGTHRINQSSTIKRGVNPSLSRRSSILIKGSKGRKGSFHALKPIVQVFDETGKDVTPHPLYRPEPGANLMNQKKIFTGHDTSVGTDFLSTVHHTMSISSAGPFAKSAIWSGSLSIVSHSIIKSVSEELEEPPEKQEPSISLSELKIERDEEIEKHLVSGPKEIYLTETENMCLLDIPAVIVSVDSEEAEEVKRRNLAYTELCKSRLESDAYVEREMQTINNAAKSKEAQCDPILVEDKGNSDEVSKSGSISSIPDVFTIHHLDSDNILHRTVSRLSVTSTVSTFTGQGILETSTVSMVNEADIERILCSEEFQQSLRVMERMVVLNIYQQKIAAYKGLPILPDPDFVPNLVEEDSVEVEEEDLDSPALEFLWSYSCELTKGRNVSCMAWNKKNPDILAVGYGEFGFRNQKPGLVCIWSLMNPTWPEEIINFKDGVFSLDFSAFKPSQLAVGLYDGTIAIYSVHSSRTTLISDSRDGVQKHRAPVWQLKWITRIHGPSGETKKESLFSVSADARISKWFFHHGLDCTDMLKLKRIRNEKTEKVWKHEPLIARWAVAMCFDFHPQDPNVYLVGTEEGHIHECSCSHNEQVMETYTNHAGPVYRVKWSPFCPDIFLSCSGDWTIQLWKQDHFIPVMSFTSIKTDVYDIMWSPFWATVFGAVSRDRLEIWDLGASLVDPILVSEAIPGVSPTSVLFSTMTDCVLVGDSEGQVSIYKIKNFKAGDETGVDTLEEIVSAALASQH
ncbi:WD repeat-containing protein 78 [Bagarius yarrelli]|uniref:Dynein axonemal intermediate chain 4 n=1 Tax=Bagarius yarrelli TaxID=175774 RepID=A0A556VYE7_BAGYA|nr:WD repeat-containing protein 78 [Bagarius yarrelli]